MFGTPDCADVGQKLWVNLCQWSQKMAFNPWHEVFGLCTTNTACLFQQSDMCIDGRCFHMTVVSPKDAKLPDPTVWGWEWHDRAKAWVPHSTDLPDASGCWCLLLHCECTVAAWSTASSTMLGFDATSFANVKVVAQTTIRCDVFWRPHTHTYHYTKC